MCGITAVVALDGRRIPKELIQKMTDAIAHRGPDAEGFYHHPGLALGHRRLSVIDLSDKGNQPMPYKNLRIVYNGEIYNFKEIRQELKAVGYAFSSETDTEVVLAAYDFWGEDCVAHFNGMWAFVIYDQANNRLFASRDRFGIKPFYWRKSAHFFAMVSEPKQLTYLPDWHPKLNKKRAFDFLSLGYHLHTRETLFDDVFALPAGSNLIFDLSEKTYRINRYYDLSKVETINNITFEQAVFKFRELFEDAVRLRMISDVKVGSALSGGLDSSSIVCEMTELGHSVETVSACFSQDGYDERPWMDAVVKKTGVTSHQTFPDLNNFIQELDQMTWFHDEPIVWPALYTQYQVFR
ncbi:MAG TPA: asparagine synthase (glutamine-hydrolyzing), partial [Saprospiraceae bacterium]|nr:asparagine synthase (glutamine-hydrolyzing) [Saprospiraceae bacterium]